MPVTFLDRLPLPSLRVYTATSVLLLSVSVYYALSVTSDPNWKANGTQGGENAPVSTTDQEKTTSDIGSLPRNDTRTVPEHFAQVISFMVQEPLCIWTLINIAYCMLALLGTLIQHLVFGKLRVSEQQHVKDKFWNFVFYKFIFVFGVINVQYMDEVLLWCSWFSILGFLHLLAQLCKDRFEYLSFSPTTPSWAHVRLLSLLLAILAVASGLMIVSVGVGVYSGLNTFAFMAAECILLALGTLHVVVRYALHLYDARLSSRATNTAAFHSRAPVAYYTQLLFDMASLVLDLAHHLHMLLWSNIFLSMASLVILMQLRYLFHELQARVRKHRMYLWVLGHMDRNYPMATKEEVAENSDNCAICWEKMESARKLPCLHLFHSSCLSSWLQQDASCPTCRRALPAWGAPPAPRRATPQPADADPTPPNHFFHFDGSRYVSWLPSFSVEVTRVRLEPAQTTSQLDAMARQVQQLFPHYPLQVIMQDLQMTRSVEVTAENILDGRLPIPPRFNAVEEENIPSPVETVEAVPSTSREDLAFAAEVNTPTLAVVGAVEDWQEDSAEELWSDSSPIPSTRFSKNSTEREVILQRRKEMLIANARKKYIEKQKNKSRREPNRETSFLQANASQNS